MSYYANSCNQFYQISRSSSYIKNNKSNRRNVIRLGSDNENKIYVDSTPSHLVYENNPYSIQYEYVNCLTVSPVGW